MTSPEIIWRQASDRLPERMLPALRRWVTLGTLGPNQETEISRRTGGRI
ncbi:MAG: hypothetical protein M3024_04075 [Candidatus Dormibacteraeota bacterium]|nr:hypothetical protein [Candidatus Dormibacteraeota bacterium]